MNPSWKTIPLSVINPTFPVKIQTQGKDMQPSWKQLAAIPESTLKAQILKALAIAPPPEGISRDFAFSDGSSIQAADDGFYFFSPDPPRSQYVPTDEVTPNWPAGTPTGDVLRAWLRRWGWLPKSERSVTAPQENTRTVI